MKICHVWDSDYPWDVRVEKVTRALHLAGHEVHIAARNKRGDAPLEHTAEATIHRIKPSRVHPGVNKWASFPAFFNPVWVSHVDRVVRSAGCDLILVRDLPLAPTAVKVARRHGIPVVLDMAENYPAMTQAIWDAGRQKPWDVVVRNPRIVKAVERSVVPKLDHVLVVIEESAERLVAEGMVSADRVTPVLNTPPLARLQAPRVVQREHGGCRLFYLGLLETPRGIAELLRGMAIARGRGVSVELDIVGSGREAEQFRKLAGELGLGAEVVRFHGYLPYDRGLELMRASDVGVVPHHANESWNTTIPNKLFDYMAAGLPVLSSSVRPVQRIVEETKSGLIYTDRDPESIAQAIAGLTSAGVRDRFGAAGREAVASRYNWEHDARALTAVVESVARSADRAAA